MGFIERILRTVLHSAAVCAGVGVCVAAYRYFNGEYRFIEFFNGLEIIAPPILAILLSLIIWEYLSSLRHRKKLWKWDMFGIAVFAVPILIFSVMLRGHEWRSWCSSSCDRFTLLFIWLVLPFIFALFRCYSCRKGKPQGQPLSADESIKLANDDKSSASAEELIKWAYDDKPSEKDYFGTAKVQAEKIANHLLKSVRNNEKGNAAIGLRGQYGSGKTTITKLVRQKVAAKNQGVLFADASAWGFDSTQSAQQYIIEQIVSAMTEAGLDTDSLIGISKRYVQALSKVHSVFDLLSVFFGATTDPQKIIGKIDVVLTQEKKKVVLILEDLDRNEGADFQLDNILATLRRLRETNNISFILTGFYQTIEKDKQDDKSENRIKDFAKICDYVKNMSDITYNEKFNMLSIMAEFHVKTKYPDDITISSRRHGESLTTTNEIGSPVLTDETILLLSPKTFGKGLYDYTNIYPAVALCSLIDTPRMIKMIIRDIDVAWEKLHGEVAYEHLLAMSILRNTGNPLLYFIREKQHDFEKTEEFSKLMDQFVKWVTNQDNHLMQEKHRKLYTRILAWYFRSGIVFDFDKIENEDVPQEESDQSQLRAICDWNENQEQQAPAIVDRILETNNFNYEKTMRSLGYIKDDTLLDLTKRVIYRLIEETNRKKIWYPLYLLSRQWHLGYDREKGETYPRICGSIERRNEVPNLLLQWFEDVFRTILTPPTKNITLCGEVLYHFGKCHEESRNGNIISFGLYYLLSEDQILSCNGDEAKAKGISENNVRDVLEKLKGDKIISPEECDQIKQIADSPRGVV